MKSKRTTLTAVQYNKEREIVESEIKQQKNI